MVFGKEVIHVARRRSRYEDTVIPERRSRRGSVLVVALGSDALRIAAASHTNIMTFVLLVFQNHP